MSKKEIKEYLVTENGKTTNIQPVSIGDNRDFLKRSLNPVFCKNCASIRCFAFDPKSKALQPCKNGSLYQPRENKENTLFEEWFNGAGCGYQACCGKSEKEKLQLAFEAGHNKADKWHYPSKGDLPVPGKEYLVCMDDETIDIQQISINGDGDYYLNGISWAFSDVIAWKEIEPPKEIK